MVTLFQTEKIYKLTQVKAAMENQIRLLPHIIAPTGTALQVFRYELPCEPIDLLTWLHNQRGKQKIYWSDRNHEFAMAGLGAAYTIEGLGAFDHQKLFYEMEDHLSSDNPHLRFYGGACFNATTASKEWAPYQNYRFIIPQFELFQEKDRTKFVFNVALKDITPEKIDKYLTLLRDIDFAPTTTYRSVPIVQSCRDIPDRKGWDKMFEMIIDKNGRNIYDKIVLARKSIFEFNKAIDPVALLKHLKDQTPNCFHFCFQIDQYEGFLGATPERLFRQEDRALESEAIAGTSLQEKNIRTEKNILEHRYVTDAIKEILSKLCDSFKADESAGLLKLQEGQHLITRFFGKLRKGVTNDEILTLLHPTPAVAGCPKDQVMTALKKIEPFDRGWYAGPIGYVGYDKSEFAVGIRSGLVTQNQLSLFAGAGIVAQSNSQDEWEEIENKISNFIKVFNQ